MESKVRVSKHHRQSKQHEIKDSLQRHLEQVHNQAGGGLKRKYTSENSASKKRRLTKKDKPDRFYDLSVVSERNLPKFRTKSTAYKVTFKELEVRGLPQILVTLQLLFQSLIKDMTEFMKTDDLIRMSIQCPELDFPITIPFMKVAQLSAETMLREIERVLQSYEQFVLDSSLEIEITHVDMPKGSGRKTCKFVDIERFLKDKKCIIQIQNYDELCCARALVTAKANIDKHPKWEDIRKGRLIQKQLALELHEKANIPLKACDLEDIKQFQSVMKDCQINVVSQQHFNGIIFQGPEAEKKIYLYHHNEHYDVITSMPAFLNRSYYCSTCQKGYQNKEEHKCNNICTSCHKIHDKENKDWIYCKDCNRYFQGDVCFQLHAKKTSQGRSTCTSYYRCTECGQSINRKMHKKVHQCGEVYCKTCKDYFQPGHLCFMMPLQDGKKLSSIADDDTKLKRNTQDEDPLQVYIFFDFECTQDDLVQCEQGYERSDDSLKCKNCKKSRCGVYEHKPNLCVVHRVCSYCLEHNVNASSTCDTCGKNEIIFSGPNTNDEFCQWLFSGENNGATVLCHNFKGYDSFPILSYLYKNGILPKIIPSGAKNMSVEIPACNIRMIDSLNFLPSALSKLPKMFGLDELQKGYFPHLFNRQENQSVVLEHLPDIKYYNPDGMKVDDREIFLEWYAANAHKKFDFKLELLKYCQSDVDILRRCCLKFRRLFMAMTTIDSNKDGIDPFEKCITIASACNLVFRKNFLRPETIGIIPAQGYNPEEKHSIKALKWLRYVSKSKGIHIQHARNGGEKCIGDYRVDGYHKSEDGEEIVFEYHGCFWHGCSKCYSKQTVNTVNKMSMADLHQRTLEKKNYLENQGYEYISKWECDFDKEIIENIDIKTFVDSVNYVTPLEPRNAFSGGRTEAFKLYHEAKDGEQIKYYDVTSLYPFINKTGKVVLGHPTIITENFDDISKYEGLIKCCVQPPRGLHIPVLPAKINNKLMFSLCRTCTELQQTTTCLHTNTERAITGTWVTDELKMAINKGYILEKIYEVWHFNDVEQYDPKSKSGGIFTEYINTFLKMKQEASGWPSWCETEAEKHKYVQDYLEKEGIQLDYNKIKKNPGLRSLAKLMLNSFWGKFGQRTNLPQVEYVSDPSVYFDMLTSDQQEVTCVNFVTDEMIEMRWRNKEEFIEVSGRTNVVIAAYTTAQARLKLYSYLDKLGDRVLYADTDSVIFTAKQGEWEPPLGDYLGELTDEVPANNITHFVTGGPKNYAYKLQKPYSDGNQTVCKVRGITLNYKNALSINFDAVKDMVTTSEKRNNNCSG
ncbi:Hypothetical predicted protein [Mytilus galloprovincialis]|uniref:DNA-directed DNA polymerase n=1 Tax=Mytilus galloprovincialis TaxID=29158 RepID=A0A8B6D3D6_MYTGA|nr:Hypothetical predicted protein [Mytilus galloprovincialis]